MASARRQITIDVVGGFMAILLFISGGCVDGEQARCAWDAPTTQVRPFLAKVHRENCQRFAGAPVEHILYIVDRDSGKPFPLPIPGILTHRQQGAFSIAAGYVIPGHYHDAWGPDADADRTQATVFEAVFYKNGEITYGHGVAVWSSDRCEWTWARRYSAGLIRHGEMGVGDGREPE